MTAKSGQSLLAWLLLACWSLGTSCGRSPNSSSLVTNRPPDVPTPLATIVPTEVIPSPTPRPRSFDGSQALASVGAQLALGPRWPGSPGHLAVREYIIDSLSTSGWEIEEQEVDYQGFSGLNIIARANQDLEQLFILGAHYDTRRLADETPGGVEKGLTVPGAVDGASGVAVLLELAESLDLDRVPGEVWLAFFDLEDNGRGGIPGWSYAAGSPFVANAIESPPAAVVVVDMVGDRDQQLYYERNSDLSLSEELWGIAADLGYSDSFIPEYRYAMLDDHMPFIQRGFKVALIIDFDYPYWHTTGDTLDKVSADSLQRVGRTLERWLER